jgi:Na+-transporting methylmalonyl-CoA/oxaloacetate decarboxylase beta subunit
MAAFDSSLLGDYLLGVLTLAAFAFVLAVGLGAPPVVRAVVRNRRTRLARHQSLRTYYGRLALHH